MRRYEQTEETERLQFAQLAATHFKHSPQDVTFTLKGLEKGAYMALRWGMGNDCVLIIKLCEYFEPVNYVQFVPRDAAKLVEVYHKAGMAAIGEPQP